MAVVCRRTNRTTGCLLNCCFPVWCRRFEDDSSVTVSDRRLDLGIKDWGIARLIQLISLQEAIDRIATFDDRAGDIENLLSDVGG